MRAERAEAAVAANQAELTATCANQDAAETAQRASDEQRQQLETQLTELEASHERDLEQLYQNFSEMRLQLQQAYRQQAVLKEAAAEAGAEVSRLRQALQQADSAAQQQGEALRQAEERQQSEWKDKYDKLFALVEPFQSQLELYRAERRCLLEQSEGTRAELERLATQYSSLLGHQNKKQKIHHIMQLKQENLSLKTDLAAAEKKLKRQRLLQRQLEERLRGDQNRTLLNNTVSSKSKTKSASYDLSKTVADPQHPGLSLLGVTPLKENTANRSLGSPAAASSALKPERGALKFT